MSYFMNITDSDALNYSIESGSSIFTLTGKREHASQVKEYAGPGTFSVRHLIFGGNFIEALENLMIYGDACRIQCNNSSPIAYLGAGSDRVECLDRELRLWHLTDKSGFLLATEQRLLEKIILLHNDDVRSRAEIANAFIDL